MFRVLVLSLSMYLCVKDIGFTSFYVFVLRISVLSVFMYMCGEDIGFTSFYVCVC